jgi:GLPGLI family protein
MKKSTASLCLISLLLVAFSLNGLAQDIKGGTVEYDQLYYHTYEKKEGPGGERYNNFIANLPSTTKDMKVLIFTSKKSLYKHSMRPEDPTLSRMKKGIQRVNYFKPPQVELSEVYINLTKGAMTKQFSFMTRFFRMEEKTRQSAWKVGAEQVIIQGYTCQNATMKKGEKIITAWFTPEIPVSTGPADYEGLPGLILSIEEDGRNTILATSIDLSEPDIQIKKPKEGTKVDQEKMDKIVVEKLDEWEKTQQQRGGRGDGGR